MVEHRTENSGVRGSNPFIGKVFKKDLLIKEKLLIKKRLANKKKILPLLFLKTLKKKTTLKKLNTPIAKFRHSIFIFNFYLVTFVFCKKFTKLNHLPKTFLKSNFFKHYLAKTPLRRRSQISLKQTSLQQIAQNFIYLFPLLNKKNKYHGSLSYNSLPSFWWYKFYLSAVTQQYTMFKSRWVLLDCSTLILKGNYFHVYKALYNKHYLQKFYCKRDKFLFWFTKLTVFKDLTSFVSMMLKWLFNSPLKKHKRIFVLINKFLKIWYEALEEFKKIRGYCIFFKGKLGKKGSVRKSKYFAKKGEVSYSTKSLKVNYKTFHFGTLTGVVGGGLSVFYTITLTFCFLYIYIYIVTLFFMLLFFITFKITSLLSQINFSVFWQSLSFFREGWVFKLLILQLAGLPPMFIFFIKFSFLVTAFNISTVFICLLVLFNLIGGMFFYLQLFKLSSAVDKKEIIQLVTKNSLLRLRGKQNATNAKFLFSCLTAIFLFLNWFSAIFFIDLYVLLNGILL